MLGVIMLQAQTYFPVHYIELNYFEFHDKYLAIPVNASTHSSTNCLSEESPHSCQHETLFPFNLVQ